jgi:hypothetical protein
LREILRLSHLNNFNLLDGVHLRHLPRGALHLGNGDPSNREDDYACAHNHEGSHNQQCDDQWISPRPLRRRA